METGCLDQRYMAAERCEAFADDFVTRGGRAKLEACQYVRLLSKTGILMSLDLIGGDPVALRASRNRTLTSNIDIRSAQWLVSYRDRGFSFFDDLREHYGQLAIISNVGSVFRSLSCVTTVTSHFNGRILNINEPKYFHILLVPLNNISHLHISFAEPGCEALYWLVILKLTESWTHCSGDFESSGILIDRKMASTDSLHINKLFSMKDAVCLVTGGGTGIGLMATQALAANGTRTRHSSLTLPAVLF
jgi:hypothetical protein